MAGQGAALLAEQATLQPVPFVASTMKADGSERSAWQSSGLWAIAYGKVGCPTGASPFLLPATHQKIIFSLHLISFRFTPLPP